MSALDVLSTSSQRVRRDRRLSGRFKPPPFIEDPEDPSDESKKADSNLELNERITSDESTNLPETSVITENQPVRRSLRKRIHPLDPTGSPEIIKPVKLTGIASEKEVTKYYLDKKVKRTNPSLETIFEEPQVHNNSEVVMSTRKFKRVINFSGIASRNSAKIKKRKVKAKNVSTKKMKKVSLKFLMEKLNEVEDC